MLARLIPILAFVLMALAPSAAHAQWDSCILNCSTRQESFWDRWQRNDLEERVRRLEQQQWNDRFITPLIQPPTSGTRNGNWWEVPTNPCRSFYC